MIRKIYLPDSFDYYSLTNEKLKIRIKESVSVVSLTDNVIANYKIYLKIVFVVFL
jgi:hypothetical protein